MLPAGGQQGTTVEVTVGGQFLQNAAEVYVSGSGVTAAVVDHARPITGGEAATLRERMQELTAPLHIRRDPEKVYTDDN